MSSGLSASELACLHGIFATNKDLEKAVLFGSRAMGLARGNSDVDIALVGQALTTRDVLRLAGQLDASPLPYQFDLLLFHAIESEDLLRHIEQYGKTLYKQGLPAGWREVELGEVCSINVSSYSATDNWKYIYYLDTGSITNNVIDEIKYIDITHYGVPSRAKRKASNNSIVYSIVRPNQNHHGIIKNCPENFIVSTGFSTIDVIECIANAKFIYYTITQRSVTEYLQSIAEQRVSTYPAIKPSDLSKTKLPLPPLETQKQIASILSAIDDKIELNNRINKNLEEQAQALFKSWFVDFEPFGGVMPEGWKTGRLSEIASVTMGQSPKGESYNEEGRGILFFQGRTEFNFRFPSARLFTTEPKRMARQHDILMSVRAPVGDINVADTDCCIGRGLAAIRSLDNCQSFVLYTLFSIKEQLNVFNGEGTVFGSINRDALNNMNILMSLLQSQSRFFL